MRWNEVRRALIPLVIATGASAASADVLILRATGPSSARFIPGHALPDASRIALRPGDKLVLLDPHGTRTLQGPGDFAASAASQGPAISLASLAGARTDRRARIGAVRNGTSDFGSARRPNIWFVDAGAPGTTCVSDPKAVTIWRAASETAGDMTVTGPTGTTAKIDWIRGQSTQGWPAAIPVAEQGEYRLSGAGAAAAGTVIRFRTPPAPSDLQGLASALVAQGCAVQLDMLIAVSQQPS